MNLLIVSDTHGRADRLFEVVRRAAPDALLFLGDGLRDLSVLPDDLPVYAVRGNCDWMGQGDVPLSREETFAGYRFFLTHGHLFGVKSGVESAAAAAAAAGADILLYGHTHRKEELLLEKGTVVCGTVLEKPLRIICPGSLGEPSEGSPAFATLTVRANGILTGFGSF